MSAQPFFEPFTAPYNYFPIPVPKGWYFFSTEHLGERQYMFSTEKVTLSELKKGVELTAGVTIRLITMDTEETDKEGLYLPISLRMAEGLQFYQARYTGETKVFKDTRDAFTLILPSEWTTIEHHSGAFTQFFISREKIEQETDTFQTGVSCTKIYRSFYLHPPPGVHSEKDLLRFRVSTLSEEFKKEPNKTFSVSRITVGGVPGTLIERSFKTKKFDYYIQEYHLALVKQDTVYDVVFEAPVAKFEIYRDLFLNAIKNMKCN